MKQTYNDYYYLLNGWNYLLLLKEISLEIRSSENCLFCSFKVSHSGKEITVEKQGFKGFKCVHVFNINNYFLIFCLKNGSECTFCSDSGNEGIKKIVEVLNPILFSLMI